MLTESLRDLGTHSINVADSAGDEPTLIMFHGVTRRWQTFLPIVNELSLRHRLLLIDARGHGLSDRAPDGEYFVNSYIRDGCELIRRYTDGPVVLYGHSLGAMTVAGVAAQLPDRVKAIVMEDPPLETMGERIRQTPLLGYFQGVSQYAGDTRSVEEVATLLGDVTYSDPVSGETFRAGDSRNAAQLRFAATCVRRLDPAVFESIVQARWLEGYNVDSVFSGLRCPSLLLQADYGAGGMLSDEDTVHVCGLNSNVSSVYFEGIPHGIHWSATSELLNTVLPFLESVRD